MAIGAETTIIEGEAVAIELLASAIAANNAPTNSAGLEINALRKFGKIPSRVRVGVISTAGTGTMTVTLRVWMRVGSLGWIVAKPFAAASSAPQTAVAIAETSADKIAYSEVVDVISGADRIYLEIVAIAGTSTAVTGYVFLGRSAEA